jgi:hypothetical protein
MTDDPRMTSLVIPLDPAAIDAPNKFHLGFIWAYMVFPDDPEMRQRAFKLAAAEHALDLMVAGQLSPVAIRKTFRKAIDAISPDDLQEKSNERIRRGFAAGRSLCRACLEGPRATKAKTALMKGILGEIDPIFSRLAGPHSDSRNVNNSIWSYAPAPSSRAVARTAPSGFKSVAHFWAAYKILEKKDQGDVPCLPSDLPNFLSLSEQMLDLGAQTKHTSGRVLNREKCFRLPPAIVENLPGSLEVIHSS